MTDFGVVRKKEATGRRPKKVKGYDVGPEAQR
jgi:hypothetical protein